MAAAELSEPRPNPELARLGEDVLNLSRSLSENYSRAQRLIRLLEQVNTGLTLDQTLAFLYDSFRPTIPFDRLELLMVEGARPADAGGEQLINTLWVRSDRQGLCTPPAAPAPEPLREIGLTLMLESGAPHLIPDLPGWCAANPQSAIGRRAAEDGARSAMFWPLVAIGRPVGFLIFSSAEPDAYRHDHGELCLDVGAQLAMIIEKSRLYQRLVQLMEEKNRFLGIVAHDLRNPLGVIKGYADLLDRGLLGDLKEQQSESVRVIQGRCRAMLNLINDLLDVSAIEAGRLELAVEEVELGKFLADFHLQNRVLAQAKGIDFLFEPKVAALRARIDRNRIEQVLNNLLSNALKFSRSGSTVTLILGFRDGNAEIAVRDQGPGIPEAELKRIFEEFQCASPRSTAGEKSTGLGLAIVKRLVAAHHGQTFVESRVGEGSTFGCRLPALAAPDTGAAIAPPAAPPPPAAPTVSSGRIIFDENGGGVILQANPPPG